MVGLRRRGWEGETDLDRQSVGEGGVGGGGRQTGRNKRCKLRF